MKIFWLYSVARVDQFVTRVVIAIHNVIVIHNVNNEKQPNFGIY